MRQCAASSRTHERSEWYVPAGQTALANDLRSSGAETASSLGRRVGAFRHPHIRGVSRAVSRPLAWVQFRASMYLIPGPFKDSCKVGTVRG